MMRAYRPPAKHDAAAAAPRAGLNTDPVIAAYIADLQARFGKYARSAEETRRIVDADMGETTLTELLYQMRSERP